MPNLFVDVAGTGERITGKKRDEPLQGMRSERGFVSLKTVTVPMKTAALNIAELPAKRDTRYFIHSYTLSGMNTAAGTSKSCGFTFTSNGVVREIKHRLVPSVANAINHSAVLDIITDVNTAVSPAMTTAYPDDGYFVLLSYQEVREDDI